MNMDATVLLTAWPALLVAVSMSGMSTIGITVVGITTITLL
jgi:hypothetical protein